MPGGEGDQVPTEFRIFSMGVNESEKGSFLFDAQSADSVMDEYRRHDKPMLLDFNHGTTYAAPTPEQAIAAGEFVPEVRTDGLWATGIKWTDRAAAALKAREYRLFSPYFEHDPKTRRVLRLINVALTNLPALDGIAPLMAASAANEGDDSMLTEEEIRKLQEKVTALSAQITERDTRIKALEGQTATVALSAVVGLSATANDGDVRARVTEVMTFRRGVLETLGKDNDAAALGALTVLKQQASEVEALKVQLQEKERVALAAEWTSYLDELSVKGREDKVLPVGKRPEVERLTLKFGGGALTRAAVDYGKEIALMSLDGRAAGGFVPMPGAPGVAPGQMAVLGKMGIKPADFAEFQKQQLVR